MRITFKKRLPDMFNPFIDGIIILAVCSILLLLQPVKVFAVIPSYTPQDSCGLVNINFASTGPSCPVFSSASSNSCQNPSGNPTNPNINSQTLTVTLSSNDGRAHQVSYWTANNFCTNGYLSTSGGWCNCTDNALYGNQIVTVPVGHSVPITITRSPTVGSNCGSYQLDFSVTAVDGNTSCNSGDTTSNIGGSLTCETGITCTGYTISGNVFNDMDKNGIKNAGETNYAALFSIAINPKAGTITTNPDGSYAITGLPAGTYTVSYLSLPNGYRMTSPLNGPPPSYKVTVGPGSCNTNGAPGASCQ